MVDMNYFGLDQSWTLFLDRDGVINEKLDGDYVKNWEEFKFKDESLEAIAGEIHDKMLLEVISVSGRIDQIYYCIGVDDNSECRKPNIGMGLKAKSDFPEIEFSKSIMVGDSISDMEFGKRLGMKRVYISSAFGLESKNDLVDFRFNSLFEFTVLTNENLSAKKSISFKITN